MTKERLEKFHELRVEIATLEARIKVEPDTVGTWDVVLDGTSGKVKPRTIVGVVESAIKVRMQARLERLSKKMLKEVEAVMDFIESIDDGLMREALTLRYVDGHNIRHTAQKIGYSEGHLSKLFAEILEKMTDDNGQ